MPACLLVVLLDDLLKASVVELSILGQIMDVGNDVAEIFLQQLKVLFKFGLTCLILGVVELLLLVDNLLDLRLAALDPRDDLSTLQLLKGEDLV